MALLTKRICQIAQGECCGWPTYNRLTHNPTENAVLVDGEIILLEGNYLLLEEPGWQNLRQYADYTIRIQANEKDLKTRLIERKMNTGVSKMDAVTFVEYSDLYNARICLEHSPKGDLNLVLNHDDSYSLDTACFDKDGHHFSSEPDIPDCGCIYG